MIKSALAATGVLVISPELIGKMAGEGVLFHGLEVVGGGAALGGLVLAAITVYIIERKLWSAAGFAAAGAVLTVFGLMHGERIGLAQSPAVAAGYVTVALFLAACAKFSGVTPLPPAAPTHS